MAGNSCHSCETSARAENWLSCTASAALQALDKGRKDLEKVRKVREPLVKRLAEEPGFMEALAAEVAQLKAQVAAS